MTTDSLIVAVARIGRGRQRSTRFYTFDHRRLWYMYQAGCSSIRVKIKPGFSRGHFDEFVSKADGLRKKVDELRVRIPGAWRAKQCVDTMQHPLRYHHALFLFPTFPTA